MTVNVFGLDFTSRPSRGKPITCAVCRVDGRTLHVRRVDGFESFAEFEAFLLADGPWVAGFDFPFGQSRRFIENIGWPASWAEYVRYVATLERQSFRDQLDNYRVGRADGDKEHRRSTDARTGAISPQKLYGVPVGLMFFEGAQRLLSSGVNIPGLYRGDNRRTAFEVYPGVLARRVTRQGYKSDSRALQSEAQKQARADILAYLRGEGCRQDYGLVVTIEGTLNEDPSGDTLDAVMCAVQAAWAHRQGDTLLRRLSDDQQLEGWIADPKAFEPDV
ncbi:MAG: DUF429 domain-containing protein [Pseudomonadota bacterium]